ncbi:Sec23/Sec24 trunk domain protein (macronuclear) [Tetrahymena thermophila SB210]|uniref:Sec23/Sec24 trunk domain protein n=1 Tax=Tetrahymena thermophila (strain SB210) TaxID=312017 RepID=Q24GF1_TETTS|nr:Sec23/Sec24 trunk domain protein [Tetrahymena thermophila SB210]EAS06920.4 Sec23/Sec24 trunk domain protein [Tetrahymena thermophila SB210]|eukprot:XP_001027162.4 Sec23/Sec24 trunk domain protein [Tetrahymena thermophila SB210]
MKQNIKNTFNKIKNKRQIKTNLMGNASSEVCVNQNYVSQQKINTNIFMVNFSFIQDNQYQIAQLNNPQCQNCMAFFNKYSISNLIDQNEATQFNKNLIQKAQTFFYQKANQALHSEKLIWVCEFCYFPNIIENLDQQIVQDAVNIQGYFEKTQQPQIKNAQQEQQQTQLENFTKNSGEQLIYVLDNSGSMSSVESYVKNGGVVQLSRKQSVIQSIQEMSNQGNSLQNKEIQLIVFSDEVQIYTNIQDKPHNVSSSSLNNWDQLIASVQGIQEQMVGVPAEQVNDLLTIYRKSNKMGSTALGPAILSAVEIAKSNRGSQIILCTDGMANQGLGSISQQQQSTQFYQDVAQYAKQKGVQVSIIGIGDDKMGLQVIGKLAEKTNGSVFKIDLSNLNDKLDNILQDKMIASDVKMKIFIHKNVVLEDRAKDDLEVDVGNATRESCITFEYLIQHPEELKDVSSIPFQAQIEYTDLNGQRQFIVVTKQIKTTQNAQEVDNNLNMEIVEKRMAQKCANLIKQGDAKQAKQYQQQWNSFVEKNDNYTDYQQQLKQQQQMIEKLASEGADNEKAQVQLQQMQQGKFWK